MVPPAWILRRTIILLPFTLGVAACADNASPGTPPDPDAIGDADTVLSDAAEDVIPDPDIADLVDDTEPDPDTEEDVQLDAEPDGMDADEVSDVDDANIDTSDVVVIPDCLADANCASDEWCDLCAEGEGESCVARCVAHGCPTEDTLVCADPRPICIAGETSIVVDGCWQCMPVELCAAGVLGCGEVGGVCAADEASCPPGLLPDLGGTCGGAGVCCEVGSPATCETAGGVCGTTPCTSEQTWSPSNTCETGTCCTPNAGGPFGTPTCTEVGGTCTSSPYGCFGTLPTTGTCDGFETCCGPAPDACLAAGRFCSEFGFCPDGFVTAADTPCTAPTDSCCKPDPTPPCPGVCMPGICLGDYTSGAGRCDGLGMRCCVPPPPPSCEDLGGSCETPRCSVDTVETNERECEGTALCCVPPVACASVDGTCSGTGCPRGTEVLDYGSCRTRTDDCCVATE